MVRNLVALRNLSEKEVIPVIKADAYGHGLFPVARALVSRGCTELLAVATLEEALEIRKRLSSVGILVLSGFFPHQIEAYIKNHIIPVIHSLNQLRAMTGRTRIPTYHIKIDTGMSRLGIPFDEIDEVIRIVQRLPDKISGLATHLSESERVSSRFSDEQIATFEAVYRRLLEARVVNTDARIHVANSGGIFNKKLGPATAVRAGLSLFGVSPNEALSTEGLIHPILEWKTRVLSLKDIPAGTSVGYNRTYRSKRGERLAILPVGYGDGYPRLLSNCGEVLVFGKRAPVRGIVSMDLIAIDVTHIPNVKEGTSATLLGKNGKDELGAWELARWAKTIPYEIFCGLSTRVPRLYFE